jgi:hypothetical protein
MVIRIISLKKYWLYIKYFSMPKDKEYAINLKKKYSFHTSAWLARVRTVMGNSILLFLTASLSNPVSVCHTL